MKTAAEPRTVSGVAGGNPALAGSGFVSVRSGVGDYTVYFAQPFPGTPTVLATVQGSTVSNASVAVSSLTNHSFRAIVSIAGAASEATFHFSASGPGRT